MTLDLNVFKAYDIRGIYPTQINEQNLSRIIQATYVFLKQKVKKDPLTVALGRDMRLSSPALHKRAQATLTKLGANVVDLGLVSTPTFYFAVFHYKFDAGIQISASHNPKEYNGLKIVYQGSHGLVKVGKTTGMEEIKRTSLKGVTVASTQTGRVQDKPGVLDDEIENSIAITANPTIKSFKIIADAANAMGSLYIDALFNKIPGELIKMNFKLDGSFPAHQPDPLQPETLVDLQKRVLKEKADLGLAPDGDGDRLFFIDEKGQIVPPSIITSLIAQEILKRHPGEKVLFDVRYILTPKKIVEENGGIPVVTKVGHAFITEALGKTAGIFAGESSGHYFFRETGNAESQLPVIITVLSVMTREKKKLSEIVGQLQRGFESGEINFKVTNALEILKKLKEQYKYGQLSTLDGIAVSFPRWRFSVRTSNTEPLLRLNVEAPSPAIMEKKRDELVNFIESIAKQP